MSTVLFTRTDNSDDIPITDGNLIFDTTSHKIFMDEETTRHQYGGELDVDDTPSTTSTNPIENQAVTNNFVPNENIVNSYETAKVTTDTKKALGAKVVKEIDDKINNLQDEIDDIVEDVSLTLVWENPNPNSNFPAQPIGSTIPSPFGGYSGYIVITKNGTSTTTTQSYFVEDGGTIKMNSFSGADSDSNYIYSRNITINGSNSFVHESYRRAITSTSVPTPSSKYMIPIKIYGVK